MDREYSALRGSTQNNIAAIYSGLGVMGFVAIMFIGQVEQGALGIHPHLNQLLIRHPTFLGFHQLLIGTGSYGDAPPSLKLEVPIQGSGQLSVNFIPAEPLTAA
ncbi:MAG: hypothetical protein NTY67_10955 [Cyanobacteria bacterium]|nr:hypothetical protein [Cyanobacteriota bacterium]